MHQYDIHVGLYMTVKLPVNNLSLYFYATTVRSFFYNQLILYN